MKKALILLAVITLFSACTSDDDKVNNLDLTFKLNHNWDGQNLTFEDFGTTAFTNANGEEVTLERLRYIISNITFYSENGQTTQLQGYQLFDLSEEETLSFTFNANIPEGNYTVVSFTLGLDEQYNISGAYADLNSVSWNWPENLGGGYHFLQMDGTYETLEGAQPFNFHMGTARLSDNTFEANYRTVFLSSDFTLNQNKTIEFNMNVAEWFKNPHTWDLNELNTELMMNYTAQKMMYDNSGSVFSLGEITTP